MTFSIAARCARTGQLGIGIATSSPAVGSRCVHVSRNGAVAYQSVPDPRLGAFALQRIDAGFWPQRVIDEVIANDAWAGRRQIGIVDAAGRIAGFTGAQNVPWAGHLPGAEHIAQGNVLAGPEVLEAMSEAFVAQAGDDLAQRLLRAIEAGRDAGGQVEGQTSAALLVYGRDTFALCDLRVDVSEEPIAELRRVFDWYEPLIPYYARRADEPDVVRYKQYLSEQGHARTFGRPVPVTRGPRAGTR
ncbi:MAG: DUF1028 domain-containing protein [Proteobacteria bacterium]|nr:DUF1028 domain-containing protein [Burkholderiales bacterium]